MNALDCLARIIRESDGGEFKIKTHVSRPGMFLRLPSSSRKKTRKPIFIFTMVTRRKKKARITQDEPPLSLTAHEKGRLDQLDLLAARFRLVGKDREAVSGSCKCARALCSYPLPILPVPRPCLGEGAGSCLPRLLVEDRQGDPVLLPFLLFGVHMRRSPSTREASSASMPFSGQGLWLSAYLLRPSPYLLFPWPRRGLARR